MITPIARSTLVVAACLFASGCASTRSSFPTGPGPVDYDEPVPVATAPKAAPEAGVARTLDAATRFSQRVFRWGTTYDDYPLDQVPRVACLDAEMVSYGGETIPFATPVRVHPHLVDRLRAFERVVETVAVEVYGRSPARLVHMGGFSCRNTAGSGGLSEHGLGNAIDLAGFDFAPHAEGEGPAAAAFRVRILDHWFAEDGFEVDHRLFLHLLTDRLLDHPEIFRRIIGPPTRLHDDHLHLDMGPSRHANFQFERDRLGLPPERPGR